MNTTEAAKSLEKLAKDMGGLNGRLNNPKFVASAPEEAKPFLQSLNTTAQEWNQEHKPAGMKTDAPGINPSRWGQ